MKSCILVEFKQFVLHPLSRGNFRRNLNDELDNLYSAKFLPGEFQVSPERIQSDEPVVVAPVSKRCIPPTLSTPLQQDAPGTGHLPHSAAAPPGYGHDGMGNLLNLKIHQTDSSSDLSLRNY